MHIAIQQLRLELKHELVDHLQDRLFWQRCKADDRIKTIAEFRREGLLDRGGVFTLRKSTERPL